VSYLLDTCAVSELVKKSPSESVVDWFRVQSEDQLLLSVITLGELQKGISKLPGSRRKTELRAWLDRDLQQRFRGRILPVDAAVALTWGRIQGAAEAEGRKMPVLDSLIAATALAHGLTVVTRNDTDVEASGVEIVDPWR